MPFVKLRKLSEKAHGQIVENTIPLTLTDRLYRAQPPGTQRRAGSGV
jgi:hypothetical protein